MTEPMIQRIGRAPNPAERALQRTVEEQEYLDMLASNYFYNVHGYEVRWSSLSEEEREAWRTRTLSDMSEHARTAEFKEDSPDDPGPGTILAA